MKMQITEERAKEIIKTYKTKTDLFNWCREYEQFINDCVHLCVSSEVDYMIKKSYEDNNSPVSYEDFESQEFDEDEAIYKILEEFKALDQEDQKEFLELLNEDLYHSEDKDKIRLEKLDKYLNLLDEDELKTLINDVDHLIGLDEDDFIRDVEVYEWWVISDPLAYRLEQQGEIFAGKFWGRQTTGQHISLDYCCISAFMSIMEDRIKH